jgi:hypothetical protein
MNNCLLKELSNKGLNLSIDFHPDKSITLVILKFPNTPNELSQKKICSSKEFERLDAMGINVFDHNIYQLIQDLDKPILINELRYFHRKLNK